MKLYSQLKRPEKKQKNKLRRLKMLKQSAIALQIELELL